MSEYKFLSGLVPKWQHVLDRVNIPTWTEVLTLAYLAELASKSERIIECGTYLGASAKVMLLANPKLHLYCIDTFTCVGEPMMLDYLSKVVSPAGVKASKDLTTGEICRWHTLKQEIEDERCFLVQGNSEDGSIALLRENIPDVDAIWIDDGHAAEDVMRDISCLMPFLKHGGEMVGHDFDVPYNDVARGVINSRIHYDVPIHRMWRHVKP